MSLSPPTSEAASYGGDTSAAVAPTGSVGGSSSSVGGVSLLSSAAVATPVIAAPIPSSNALVVRTSSSRRHSTQGHAAPPASQNNSTVPATSANDPQLDTLIGSGVHQINEISREDILHQIFGDIGDLIDDFSCAVESTVLLHGRMYITNKFICFYSNLFGLEKKIRIPYSHIRNITKENTAIVIPNAISISTNKKDYCFRSFWDREDCFRMLSGFLDKVRKGQQIKAVPRLSAVVPHGSSQDRHASLPNRRSSASQRPAADSAGIAAATSSRPLSVPSPSGAASPVSSAAAVDGTPSLPDEGDDNEFDTESGVKVERNLAAGGDIKVLFSQEAAKSAQKISVVSSEVLDISINDFAALFIADNAPYSYKKYHEQVKDTNVVASNWTDMSSVLGADREIKFFKPVNLPGLASTRGVKVQRYRRFEDAGLILLSSTRLEDVPAADTFSVEDVLVVKSIDGFKCSVDVSFEVKFIKSTYMKFIIERSTNVEMKKWLDVFFKHLQKVCKLHKEGKQQQEQQTTTEAVIDDAETDASEALLEDSISVSGTSIVAHSTSAAAKISVRDGIVSLFSFKEETRGDQVRIFLCLLLALYLAINFARWNTVQQKLDSLENQLRNLEALTDALLSHVNKSTNVASGKFS